jgi:hypothetical protein
MIARGDEAPEWEMTTLVCGASADLCGKPAVCECQRDPGPLCPGESNAGWPAIPDGRYTNEEWLKTVKATAISEPEHALTQRVILAPDDGGSRRCEVSMSYAGAGECLANVEERGPDKDLHSQEVVPLGEDLSVCGQNLTCECAPQPAAIKGSGPSRKPTARPAGS